MTLFHVRGIPLRLHISFIILAAVFVLMDLVSAGWGSALGTTLLGACQSLNESKDQRFEIREAIIHGDFEEGVRLAESLKSEAPDDGGERPDGNDGGQLFESFQAPPSARGSFGKPSTRSPTMLRCTSLVPA